MAAVQGSSVINEVNRLVYEVFGLALLTRENVWPKVFTQKDPTRKDEKVTIIKLDNTVTETADGGAFTPSNILEIGTYTVTQKIYKDSVTLGDFAEVFDNYGAIKQAAQEKGLDYAYKQDELAVDFLNNATSTTSPYGFIVDNTSTNTSLISNTQPIGNTGSTQDNLVAGGLSEANFNSAWQLLRDMKRHNGNVAGYRPKRLVVPTEQYFTAWKLLMSPDSPQTADRARNPINSMGVELIHWDLLTNSSNCFLMADQMLTPHFVYFIKKAPTMKVIRNQQTDNIEYQFSQMLMAGNADYQGLVGITA